MKNFIPQAICGAATGIGIGVTLLVLALSRYWLKGPMDDPGLSVIKNILLLAIPLLLLTAIIGTIVQLIVEFVRRIIVRHRQNQEQEASFDEWIRGLKN